MNARRPITRPPGDAPRVRSRRRGEGAAHPGPRSSSSTGPATVRPPGTPPPAVTPMSVSLPGPIPAPPANRARSRRETRAARFVHDLVPVLMAAVVLGLAAGGCVIPPSLSLEENDAAVNNPPVLHDVRDEVGNPFERPGPRDIVVGQGRLVITASDNDLDDTLYVRFYMDYGLVDPTPAKITCQAAPGASPTIERQVTCSLIGVCTASDVGTEHMFEIDLYDRTPIDDEPTRINRSVAAPGEVSTWWWKVECRESST